MHCQQSDALVRYAAPDLQDVLLPRIARGELYLASVTTEPGKGGHLLTGQSPLRHSDETLTLEREAPVVTGGHHADGFLITMRATPDAADTEVTLVYADREQLRMVPRTAWDTLGMRGTQSGGLALSGTLPAVQTVGAPGGFRRIATESMAPVGHLAWAACWLGTARAALEGLVGQVRSANHPPGIDPRSDLALERLARIRMDLELVGAYLHRVRDEVLALRAEDRCSPPSRPSSPTTHFPGSAWTLWARWVSWSSWRRHSRSRSPTRISPPRRSPRPPPCGRR
ncbi:hypothetical protein GCM10010341_87630 [Streptomyces noursei]|nr:hypothetical protein GCM10010341_87630 [Streptomyces noursei]